MLDVYGGEYEFISIHAPAGGATGWGEEILPINEISIHAPAGGATNDIMHDVRMMVFQFTPLREGRPARNQELIHGKLFQFTPLREGRHIVHAVLKPVQLYFNSRPCGRGDAEVSLLAGFVNCISIHAPAGGATRAGRQQRDFCGDFNSRPCGRGDAPSTSAKA